jgi:hypothetical protein
MDKAAHPPGTPAKRPPDARYDNPVCRSRGVVEAPDLVTREKAVVLRNAGSRYNVEVADFTRGNSLPIFSLIFTEFES